MFVVGLPPPNTPLTDELTPDKAPLDSVKSPKSDASPVEAIVI